MIGFAAAVAIAGMIAGGSSKVAVVFVEGVIWIRLPCWNNNCGAMSGEVAIVAVWIVFSCSWKIWVELLQLEVAEPLQSSILIKVCEGIGIGMAG